MVRKKASRKRKKMFDIAQMNECFDLCQKTDGFSLQHYNDGFKHIINFFDMMGKVFSFVASDVRDKVRILEEHSNGPKSEDYKLIDSFLVMEQKENLSELNTKQFASASRTLLRLHRALEFIAKLFGALSETEEHHLGQLSKDIYHQTLAKYHPFLVRKGAEFGMMHGVPYREKLVSLIAPVKEGQDEISEEEIRELLSKGSETLLNCHAGIDALYTKYNLHDLP